MGKRFVIGRHIQGGSSDQRVTHLLNEAEYEPHHSRPYGLASGKFGYRSMFQDNQSRVGNRRVNRVPKKAARQQARRWLLEQEQEGHYDHD